jgi:membrane-associated protein
MIINTNLTQIFETFSYAGLFLWLILYNTLFFIPLPPEEAIVLTVGYVASLGYINPFLGGLLIATTALLTDSGLFFLTKKGDKFINKIIKKFGEKIFSNYKNKMGKNISRTIITLAFIPRLRFFGPIILASLNTKWKKFLIYDFLANIIFCTTYILIGYLFHSTITKLINELETWKHLTAYIILVSITLVIVFFIKQKLSNDNKK